MGRKHHKPDTAYSVQIDAQMAIDLTASPLNREARQWEDLTNYAICQDLTEVAREAVPAPIDETP